MHNGIFSTLSEVVEFYDTSFNVTPKINRNINQGGRIGELDLKENQNSDLVAFWKY